jgi:hypothetical protein
VVSATLLSETTVVLVKPDPVRVSVVSDAPANTLAGLTLLTVGGVVTVLPPPGGVPAFPVPDELLLHPKKKHAQTVMTAQRNLRA